VLRAALQQAAAEGLIDENPAAKCKPPRPAKFQPVVLNDAEMDRFLAAAEGHRPYALFGIALRTGMRMGELLGLKWRDIDWANKAAHVDRTLQDSHGPIARELGLDPARFHDLRHTHFQGLADEGVSPRGIADRAGHADPAFAMRVYTRRSIAGQEKAVEILNAKSSRKTRQN
jgi:integrase